MTKTIKSQDGHTFLVKEEFRCKNPEDYFAYDLINDWNLIYYMASFDDRLSMIFDEEEESK